MDTEQMNNPAMEGGNFVPQQETSSPPMPEETTDALSEDNSALLEELEDNSLLLKGRIIVTQQKETSEEVQIRSESLLLRGYESDESWDEVAANTIDGNKMIRIDGGTLSRQEDGSLLIEGGEDAPAALRIDERKADEQAVGFLVKHYGESLIAGENQAADTHTDEVQTEEASKQNTLYVEWADGKLQFSNPMTFHAAENGWHVEEQIERIEILSYPGGEAWAAENGSNIGEDKLVYIEGGICTVQDGGDALIIDSSKEHPVAVSVRPRDGSHETHTGICVEYVGSLRPIKETPPQVPPVWVLGGAALLAALIGAGITALIKGKKTDNRHMSNSTTVSGEEMPLNLGYGQLQQIGRRNSQQDCMGLYGVRGGLLAVVADGMGGLKNGDAVSQKIVQTFAADCRNLSAAQISGNLMAMAAHANDEVNRMLGPSELYKSGSTLVAVLAEPQQFSWVSIGDSRIYLYRAGRLLQLNREHNFEADLVLRAVNHQLSFQEARNNPKRRSVSSFIGMGNLKYVDEMQRPIQTIRGDRIVVCSDGVYNTLSEQRIEAILSENPIPKVAAEKMEAAVVAANNPHQDNFTAIILSYD